MLLVISISYNNNNVIHYSPKMRYFFLNIAIHISIEPIVLGYFLTHVLLFLKLDEPISPSDVCTKVVAMILSSVCESES